MDLYDCLNDELCDNIDKNNEESRDYLPAMERQRNILLAKKYMVESIYRSANIEGIGMTFPETQTICDGMSISGHTIDEINAINDLKNAWKWLFQNIDNNINIDCLCTLNRSAGNFTVIDAGCLRDKYDEPIRVPLFAGKNYYPPLPKPKEEINKDIENIIKNKDFNAAFELFCYVCKGQFFNDGNKRTATLITNMYMIQNGFGIFSIPVDKKLDFYNNLTLFYSDDIYKEQLINFLKEFCITGYKPL